MLIIGIGTSVIPYPEGVDPNDMESLKAAMPGMGFKYFIFPFLAHAIGSLAGGFLAAKLSASHHKTMALVVGGFHMIGGIAAVIMLPAPPIFEGFDLIFAYLPAAWLGWKLSGKN